jgi:transposase
MAQIKSWTVSDELWNKIEPLVPVAKRPEDRIYKRKPGGGRKPLPARQVFEAIVYVLRTGCQWKALPRYFGSASAVHKRFQAWFDAGFFLAIWQTGLAEYDAMEGIAWTWQSIDGALCKAPLALECVGPNPTDRGKKRAQAQPARRRPWGPVVARRQRRQRA